MYGLATLKTEHVAAKPADAPPNVQLVSFAIETPPGKFPVANGPPDTPATPETVIPVNPEAPAIRVAHAPGEAALLSVVAMTLALVAGALVPKVNTPLSK